MAALLVRSSANKIPGAAEQREEDAVGVAAFLMECSCLAMQRCFCQNAKCPTALQCTQCPRQVLEGCLFL